MKELKQSILINKPIEAVFAFTINPDNTPKWVESIVTEKTSEWPVKLGSVYRNQDRAGEWSEYVLTVFEPNKTFTLTQSDGNYLRYTFTEPTENTTNLAYEWVGDELEESALREILEKLKTVIEAEQFGSS